MPLLRMEPNQPVLRPSTAFCSAQPEWVAFDGIARLIATSATCGSFAALRSGIDLRLMGARACLDKPAAPAYVGSCSRRKQASSLSLPFTPKC